MLREIRIRFIAIVILTVVAAYVVIPIEYKPSIPVLSEARLHLGFDLAGGAELRYKVLFPPGFDGDRDHATRLATDVLRRRLETKPLHEHKVSTHGHGGIVIQLAGVDEEGMREYKRLIETLGSLELYAAAPQDLQERHDRDSVVPEGYKAVRNTDGRWILIQDHPVVEGRHVVQTEPQQEMSPGGMRWFTSFELDAEGARMFDESAERLYRQQPRGRIVILVDGAVKSSPVVQSPSFQGRGRISGAKDQKEARDLAIILRSGSLPFPIGSE